MPEPLDKRIAELEERVADPAASGAGLRADRIDLATSRCARYIQYSGGETDRVRAQELCDVVLADEAATVLERQRASLSVALLTLGGETVVNPLLGHSPEPDAVMLSRTEEWTCNSDPAEVAAGVEKLVENLSNIADPGSLPPNVLGSLNLMRTLAPLLGPGADSPDAVEILKKAADAAPPDTPGLDLLRVLETWLRPARTEERVTELEGALAGLSEEHLLTPVLRKDLAQALIGRADRGGPDGLARATALMEQAAAGMAEDHPFYDDTIRVLAGALVATAAAETSEESLARAESVAADVLAQARDGGPATTGSNLFLRSMVGVLRGHSAGGTYPGQAVEDLVEAIETLPADHGLRPAAIGQLAAILSDRHLREGQLEDAEAARHLLDRTVDAVSGDNVDPAAFLTCLSGVSRINQAIRVQDDAELSAAADALRAGLDRLPAGHLMRPNLELVLNVAGLRQSMVTGGSLQDALGALRGTVKDRTFVGIPTGVLKTMTDTTDVLDGLLAADPGAIVDGINRMESHVADAAPAHQATQRALLGKAYLVAHDTGVHPDEAVVRAIDHLEQARDAFTRQRAGVALADVLRELAQAYRRRGDGGQSRRVAFEALAVHAGTVLLQTGVGHAVVTARGTTAEAAALAAWCLDDGDTAGAVQAVELGRGLALHAATSALAVTGLLRRIGRSDLAVAWEADAQDRRTAPAPWSAPVGEGPGGVAEPDHARAATDLRHKVLAVLRSTAEGSRLFTPPTSAEIGVALAATGVDALVYLLPGADDRDGHLLVIDQRGVPAAVPAPALRIQPDGPPERFSRAMAGTDPAAKTAALSDVCDWAGTAVLEALRSTADTGPRPARVVLVPSGILGAVPWPAARLPEGGLAVAEFVLSSAASARQFLDTASRVALPLYLEPVLVAAPRSDHAGGSDGELLFAADEVVTLHDVFYPGADILGDLSAFGAEAEGPCKGAGTPDEVLTRLPGARSLGASVLHLACHAYNADAVEKSYLALTDQLTIRAVLEHAAGRSADTPGPLVVLSTCVSDLTEQDYDEALTLATAFVVAGAVGVVGSRWKVDDQATAIAMFAFHHFLTQTGRQPAEALRAAQLWMVDTDRPELPGMPEAMLGDLTECDLTDVATWAAFGFHGR
jgi:hypothetical protein